jgi:Zn-dependent protease/CBS domain-containing protein
MSWSLRVLRVNGIPIRIHFTFLLVVAWAVYIGLEDGGANWLQNVGFMVAFVLLLFLCVLLHELGHSLVAQLFGVKVVDITLLPIGGLARMTKMPDRPYQEFVMAAAGPATNIALAAGLSLVAVIWLGPGEILSLALSSELLGSFLSGNGGQTLLALLILNNVFLAVFNLIPAFPLDGGRMLRSFLAALISHRRATSIASYVGQMLALVLGMGALFKSDLFLGLIAVFIFIGAWQEREQGRQRVNMQGLSVRQAMQPVGLRLHPLQTIGEVAACAAASPQTTFLVLDGGRLAGLLTRSDLLSALSKPGPTARVGQRMHREIPQFAPDDPLAEAGDRLSQGQGAAIVVEAGQVIGTLSRPDLHRLTEALRAHPEVLPRE